MPNRVIPKPGPAGFTNPDDILCDSFLGWYFNLISYLVTKLAIPRSASIIRLGRRIESTLLIPKCIRLFHPPPIEPGMTDDELGKNVEFLVSFGILVSAPGFPLIILSHFDDPENDLSWQRNSGFLLVFTLMPVVLIWLLMWVVFVGKARKARRELRRGLVRDGESGKVLCLGEKEIAGGCEDEGYRANVEKMCVDEYLRILQSGSIGKY